MARSNQNINRQIACDEVAVTEKEKAESLLSIELFHRYDIGDERVFASKAGQWQSCRR
jgi:hypothetical protein